MPGRPAARVTDLHVCPMVTPGTPPVPHVGGPIIPTCSPNVITGGMPQARVTDKCTCVGPLDAIVMGSPTVLVNSLQAARIGDPCTHGGTIITGFPTVLIGEIPGGSSPAGEPLTMAAFPAAVGDGPAATSEVKNPCSGRGLSNQANVDSFAKGMAALKADWKNKTPEERRQAMEKTVESASKAAGMPAPKVKITDKLGPNTRGELHFRTWDVAINKKLVDKDDISDDDFAQLSGTLYHETRHAEQWYLIARRDAAQGLTATQIEAKRGILPAAAVEAAKSPLKKGAPQRACADAMFESIYGKNAAARNQTLKNLKTNPVNTKAARDRYDASRVEYELVSKDKSATDEEKAAALRQLEADRKLLDAVGKVEKDNYDAYRALPEEYDAWDSGNRANAATKKALQPPPKLVPVPKKG